MHAELYVLDSIGKMIPIPAPDFPGAKWSADYVAARNVFVEQAAADATRKVPGVRAENVSDVTSRKWNAAFSARMTELTKNLQYSKF